MGGLTRPLRSSLPGEMSGFVAGRTIRLVDRLCDVAIWSGAGAALGYRRLAILELGATSTQQILTCKQPRAGRACQ
jgi:hypothetical protein